MEIGIRAGTVQQGGTVTIAADALWAQQESTIAASGAGATLDLPADQKHAQSPDALVATTVTSDAGTINIALTAPNFGTAVPPQFGPPVQPDPLALFDPDIIATAGGPQQKGGILNITAPAIVIADSSARMQTGYPGNVFIAATGRLTGSGIDALSLTTTQYGIGLAGDVDLSLGRQLIVNSSALVSLPEGDYDQLAAIPANAAPGAANVSAPYVRWQQQEFVAGTPSDQASIRGTLNITGGNIDLGGNIAGRNLAALNIDSAGDVRFVPAFLTQPSLNGSLTVGGGIALRAVQIYPTTEVSYAVISTAQDGLINLLSNGSATSALCLPAVPSFSAPRRLCKPAWCVRRSGIWSSAASTARICRKERILCRRNR